MPVQHTSGAGGAGVLNRWFFNIKKRIPGFPCTRRPIFRYLHRPPDFASCNVCLA